MQVRGKANGLATAVNWTCNLMVATTFLSLADTFSTAVTFWLYACLSFSYWMLVVRMVPEVRHQFIATCCIQNTHRYASLQTKGKSLEEIQSLLRQ